MAKALCSLDACIVRVSKDLGTKGEYNDKAASHLAWLTKHVAQILGELRKLEAHDRAIASKMSPEERDKVVVEYIRTLPTERVAELRRLLDDVETGSIL